MTASMDELTSPDVAEHIRRSPTAVIAFGSVEQHGPHLPCGTDAYAAELVAREVARLLDALYVPFCPYGITPIHAGHPGTISLRREVFEGLLRNVCEELAGMGVRDVVLVNWHEGNNASLDAIATELQAGLDLRFVVAHACYVAERLYRDRGGSLTHGGGIETMAVMARDPSLLRLERVGTAARPPRAEALDALRRAREVHGFVTDVREIADEGWYGDPGWATPELAAGFAGTVAAEIVARVREIMELTS